MTIKRQPRLVRNTRSIRMLNGVVFRVTEMRRGPLVESVERLIIVKGVARPPPQSEEFLAAIEIVEIRDVAAKILSNAPQQDEEEEERKSRNGPFEALSIEAIALEMRNEIQKHLIKYDEAKGLELINFSRAYHKFMVATDGTYSAFFSDEARRRDLQKGPRTRQTLGQRRKDFVRSYLTTLLLSVPLLKKKDKTYVARNILNRSDFGETYLKADLGDRLPSVSSVAGYIEDLLEPKRRSTQSRQ